MKLNMYSGFFIAASAAMIAVTAVHAQSASAPQMLKSDSWSAPTQTSPAPNSLTLAESADLPKADKQAGNANSPFKFKDGNSKGPMGQPPPSAHDQAAVMGEDRAWQNGRPPVNCAMTPQDPTCH